MQILFRCSIKDLMMCWLIYICSNLMVCYLSFWSQLGGALMYDLIRYFAIECTYYMVGVYEFWTNCAQCLWPTHECCSQHFQSSISFLLKNYGWFDGDNNIYKNMRKTNYAIFMCSIKDLMMHYATWLEFLKLKWWSHILVKFLF